MIAVRLSAPLVWRSARRTAQKLEGFAAAEAGSALDMLKAAELCEDPKLRRLFFRHAMDEARHAELFRSHARAADPDPTRRRTRYQLIHATRQNLFAELGLMRFIAFVFLAERKGEAHFRALARHFAGDQDLAALFQRVGKDERFHVAYSRNLLVRWQKAGDGAAVRRALWSVRVTAAWQAWRRAGRRIGDLMTSALFALVYFLVLPWFVASGRRAARAHAGWQRPQIAHSTPRSQF